LCITLISPIKKIPLELNDVIFNAESISPTSDGEEFRELQIGALKNELAENVIKALDSKFGIVCNMCEIELFDEDDGVVLNLITLDLDTESEFIKSDVKKYLGSQFECEIYIIETENKDGSPE